MNKQSNNSTWNSLSDEFKQLITQRLGEPMARKIANIKNDKFKLNCAIANALFYDLNSMRDETLNLDLVYKLFPEIWPSQPVEEPAAEVLDDPIFLITLNHNGDSNFVQKLVAYCKHISKKYPTQILTESENIFEDKFTFKTQCSFTMLFKIAINVDRFDPENKYLHDFSVQ